MHLSRYLISAFIFVLFLTTFGCQRVQVDVGKAPKEDGPKYETALNPNDAPITEAN